MPARAFARPTRLRSEEPTVRVRDRLAAESASFEIAAAEAKLREERERPIREATEKLNETHRALAKVEVERLTGKAKDPAVWIDPAVLTVRMKPKDADAFNVREFQRFQEERSDLFVTDVLLDDLGAYFKANGIRLVTASMLGKLIDRYAALHLLPERPPEPVPETTHAQEPEPQLPVAQTFTGVDLRTGLPREYSPYEVHCLTADEYRRAFRL